MKRTIFAALLALGTTPLAAQEMNVQELAEAMYEACEDHRNGEDVFFMYSIGERYCRDVPEDRPDFSISMRRWDEPEWREPEYRRDSYEDNATAEIIDEMGDMMEAIVAAPKTNTVYVPVPVPMPRATTPTRKVTTTTRTPTRKVTTAVSPKPTATTRTAPKPKATTRTASKPKPKAKAKPKPKRTTTRKSSTTKKKR